VTFEAWLGRLRNDGYLLCPTNTAVPVELRAVRPDGWGLHLRCRGVRVSLGLYRPGRCAWQVPLRDRQVIPEEALELWEHRPLHQAAAPGSGAMLPPGTRIAFTGAHDTPDHELIFDGSRERGWQGHEAGLLGAGGAAEIFATLLAAAEPHLARWRPALAGAGPIATPRPAAPTASRALPGVAVPAARGDAQARPALLTAANRSR